jgi:hypothetical protein
MGRWGKLVLFASLVTCVVTVAAAEPTDRHSGRPARSPAASSQQDPPITLAQATKQSRTEAAVEASCETLRSRRFTGKVKCAPGNGGRFEGTMNSGNYEHGTYTRPDGESYCCSYRDNLADGQGQTFWPNGQIAYEGEYRNGKWDGEGKSWGPKGDYVYIGSFRNGVFDGWGKAINMEGHKFEGYFRNGLPNGPGTRTDPNGLVWRGNWVNGCVSDDKGRATFFTTLDRC